jgi:hypothetical protein
MAYGAPIGRMASAEEAMSVALLITHSSEPHRLVPVATEQVFGRSWEPLCIKLNLETVCAMRDGLDITTDNIEDLRTELRMLHDHLSTTSDPPSDNIIDRVALVLRALDEVDVTRPFEAWAG